MQTVTRAEFLADAASILTRSETEGPILVLDENGKPSSIVHAAGHEHEEKLCNLCGLTCNLTEGAPHGLIDGVVSGGYTSTPGNGAGALDDGETYSFNLCEFCLDWLFCTFVIPPDQHSYIDGTMTDFVPAARRVAEDAWREMKEVYATERDKRDAARWTSVRAALYATERDG